MRAVIAAIESGELVARTVLVASNRAKAPALQFAREHGVPTLVVPTAADPEGADARLARAFRDAGADWIVLSGYLRRVGPKMLAAFPGRMLNVHPALLPAFGGQGMYGRRVHEAVAAARPTHTGATVHLVDDEYDHGPALMRVEIPLGSGDTAQTIEAKVMAAEPRLMVDTLKAIASGAPVGAMQNFR